MLFGAPGRIFIPEQGITCLFPPTITCNLADDHHFSLFLFFYNVLFPPSVFQYVLWVQCRLIFIG